MAKEQIESVVSFLKRSTGLTEVDPKNLDPKVFVQRQRGRQCAMHASNNAVGPSVFFFHAEVGIRANLVKLVPDAALIRNRRSKLIVAELILLK